MSLVGMLRRYGYRYSVQPWYGIPSLDIRLYCVCTRLSQTDFSLSAYLPTSSTSVTRFWRPCQAEAGNVAVQQEHNNDLSQLFPSEMPWGAWRAWPRSNKAVS